MFFTFRFSFNHLQHLLLNFTWCIKKRRIWFCQHFIKSNILCYIVWIDKFTRCKYSFLRLANVFWHRNPWTFSNRVEKCQVIEISEGQFAGRVPAIFHHLTHFSLHSIRSVHCQECEQMTVSYQSTLSLIIRRRISS